MLDVLNTFVKGAVAIGMATALFLPGRTTAKGIKAGFSGASQLLGTAEGLRKR